MRANRIAEFRAFLKYNHRQKTESGILMEKSDDKERHPAEEFNARTLDAKA